MKPKEFYGHGRRIFELGILYAPLTETICSENDRKNYKRMGDLRWINEQMEFELKAEKKVTNSIYRKAYFRALGIDSEKVDDKPIEKIRKKLEEEEKWCRTIESLPRTKKTLSELSENMSIPINEVEEYLKKAKKDRVIEEIDGSFQLTTKGLEVAYASLSAKEHGTGIFFTWSKKS
jgi:hypothetical protein